MIDIPTRGPRPAILATGGAGYIGSHVTVALAAAGYRVVILDNFENSSREAARHIPRLAGGGVTLIEGDVRDAALVEHILHRYGIDGVIHLAGKKAVGESVADPMLYFRDNVAGAVALLSAMQAAGTARLVFSSSATVYGVPKTLPIREDAPVCAVNPYGRTKLMIEEMIEDLAAAWPEFRAISLRYFNPVGAHPSALLGERPNGVPNNLFPFVAQTAAGLRKTVRIYGDDYDTPDGTGVRDYIHVMDLAAAHLDALALTGADTGVSAINVGSGRGHSVMEVIRAFKAASGRRIPYAIAPRRAGDVATLIADPALAARRMNWRAVRDLDEMCADAWRWRASWG